VQRDLSISLGSDPSDDQMAEALDITVEQLHTYRQLAAGTISLSTPIGEDGDASLFDFIEDELCEAPMDEAVRARSAEELREALRSLSGREQRVLELRFGLADGRERTLEQVGREFKLTRERIRQIESKALAKLRHPARRQELDAFLD
jgi:RNA polymerase primary sigma factor